MSDTIASDDVSTEQKLIDLLGSAASYNDKGIAWSDHDAEKVSQMQAQFRSDQLRLARTIGADRLGRELFAAIEQGAAAKDGSGRYADLAQAVLGMRRTRP